MLGRLQKALPSEVSLRIIALTIFGIVVAMPFHGLLSVGFGAAFDAYTVVRLWKEALIIGLLLVVLIDMYTQRAIANMFLSSRLNQVAISYIGLHLISYILLRPELESTFVAFAINLRFIVLFLIGRWLMLRTNSERYPELVARSLIGVLAVAVIFAFAKDEVVSEQFWRSFGYGQNTLPIRYTLDNNESLVRLAGTTRGPNILALLASLLALVQFDKAISLLKQALDTKRPKVTDRQVIIVGSILLAALFILYLTYSRSGLLAFIIGAAMLSFFAVSRVWRFRAAYVAVPLGLALAAVLFANIGSSSFLRTIILHDDPNSGGTVTSTSKRLEANQAALEDVINEPFGRGPGTAGPASFYNDAELRIAENYYLQIAQEVGIVGAAIFLSLIVMIALRLNVQRNDFWPRILLVSLIGISVAGLFTHVWADDEVALIWWGLAGLFVRD